MHVFITGGTGLIGSAVVAELLGNGHTVLALARSDASALAVERAGAEPLSGTLADLDVLRTGASKADGVIQLAFSNDFSSADAVARSVATCDNSFAPAVALSHLKPPIAAVRSPSQLGASR